MARQRIHQLAAEWGVESREIVERLEKMGIHGKRAQSVLTEGEAKRVREGMGFAEGQCREVVTRRTVERGDGGPSETVITETRVKPGVVLRRTKRAEAPAEGRKGTLLMPAGSRSRRYRDARLAGAAGARPIARQSLHRRFPPAGITGRGGTVLDERGTRCAPRRGAGRPYVRWHSGHKKRNEHQFPTEEGNLFSEVDLLVGPDGRLHSVFEGEMLTEKARQAIRGQNTWMLWSQGNEAFWGWLLQDRNYGITDFLILLDSRKRQDRFKHAGLVNQPGMKARTDPASRILGLYLDQVDGGSTLPKPTETYRDPRTGERAALPPGGQTDLFTPGEPERFTTTGNSPRYSCRRFVPAKTWQTLLHNQTAWLIKAALLYRRRSLGVPFLLADAGCTPRQQQAAGESPSKEKPIR